MAASLVFIPLARREPKTAEIASTFRRRAEAKMSKNADVNLVFEFGAIIVLEGGIAVGKSTLAAALGPYLENLGYCVVTLVEPLDAQFLALYQKNIAKYAFPFQSVVARERMQLYKEAQRLASLGNIVIMDRSLPGDFAFATMQRQSGYFTDEEWAVYHSLLGLQGVDKGIDPDFMKEATILYFDAEPATMYRRMLKRGNANEIDAYDLDYFCRLRMAYEKAMDLCAAYHRIDWDEDMQAGDFVDFTELLESIPALRHLVYKHK
jgi:deoxyadenosine/deoxycytidine kinase